MAEQRIVRPVATERPELGTPVSGGAVARAYDRLAASYDGYVAGDRWIRSTLWTHYARVFRAGDRVLDVSCGTGLDGAFLAQRGVRVTGIDISPGMVDEFRERARRTGLAHLMDALVMDAADLSALDGQGFDGLISAFAGLNTLPDLGAFAAGAARALRPGGRVVVHLLNRFSSWEWLVLVRQGRWNDARALGRGDTRDFTIGGETVPHHLYAPREAYRAFAPHFELEATQGLGAVCPPPSLVNFPAGLRRALERLDPRLGVHAPLRERGRFFVLDMTARPARGTAHDGP